MLAGFGGDGDAFQIKIAEHREKQPKYSGDKDQYGNSTVKQNP